MYPRIGGTTAIMKTLETLPTSKLTAEEICNDRHITLLISCAFFQTTIGIYLMKS